MVRKTRREHLRLRFQPAKGSGVDNTVAVARVIAPVRMSWLRVTTPAGIFCVHRPRREVRSSVKGMLFESHGSHRCRAGPHACRPSDRLAAQDFGATVSRPRSASSEMAESGNSFLIC